MVCVFDVLPSVSYLYPRLFVVMVIWYGRMHFVSAFGTARSYSSVLSDFTRH